MVLAWFAISGMPAVGETGIRATSTTPTVNTRGVPGADVGAQPRPPSIVRPPESPSAPASPETTGPRFHVDRIRFSGNSVISTEELAVLAHRYEERDITLDDLTRLRREVRQLYDRRGYFLTKALLPPQTTSTGQIRIAVLEARFGEVRVEGNQFYTDQFIRRFFRRAIAEDVIRREPIQRALLLLNEYPDLLVASVFETGKEKGTADMVLKVNDGEPLHAILEYNDYGTLRLGRSRVGLAVTAENIFADGDEVFGRATYLLPRTEDPLFQASYTLPLGNDGDKLSFSYSNSAVVLGADVAVLDIRGNADIYGLSFSRPTQRTVDRSANLSGSFLFKTATNFILGTQQLSQDDLRLLSLGYDGQIQHGRLRTLYSASLTQGLGTFLNGRNKGALFPNGQPRASRAGAGDELTKLNVDVFLIQRNSSRDYLIYRAGGQLANEPLAVIEQFGLGGPESVRGYLQSEFLGDDGYTASVEFRHSLYDGKSTHSQLAVFADHGHASLKLPRAGEQATRTLNGVGAGVRLAVGTHLSAKVDLGFPLAGPNIELLTPVIYGQLTNRW